MSFSNTLCPFIGKMSLILHILIIPLHTSFHWLPKTKLRCFALHKEIKWQLFWNWKWSAYIVQEAWLLWLILFFPLDGSLWCCIPPKRGEIILWVSELLNIFLLLNIFVFIRSILSHCILSQVIPRSAQYVLGYTMKVNYLIPRKFHHHINVKEKSPV